MLALLGLATIVVLLVAIMSNIVSMAAGGNFLPCSVGAMAVTSIGGAA